MGATGWQPVWLPSHAYTVGAFISPTTFTGWLWRCTQAGTSDVSEPAWPNPPTAAQAVINDNSVQWTLSTGFRQAVQLGLMTTLNTYKSANPTIVTRVGSVRPKSFATNLPILYLGMIDEQDTLTAGTWRRLLEVEVFYVDVQPDSDQLNSRQNFVVDTLLDSLASAFHSADPRAITEPQIEVEPRDFDEGGVLYAGVLFKLRGYITVGRT